MITVEVLFFYAGQCTEREAPISKDEVSSTICEIEERGLAHDADRRKILFGTLMVWRGVVGFLFRSSHHACMLPYCRFWAYCRFWLMGMLPCRGVKGDALLIQAGLLQQLDAYGLLSA